MKNTLDPLSSFNSFVATSISPRASTCNMIHGADQAAKKRDIFYTLPMKFYREMEFIKISVWKKGLMNIPEVDNAIRKPQFYPLED